jgi:predicted nucleic acid-binding protein
MKVLADTSVWSLLLRRPAHKLNPAELAIRERLVDLLQDGRAQIIGPVRQELLTGLRDRSQFDALRRRLLAFEDVVIDSSVYQSAASAANDCLARGIAVTNTDILLCALSLKTSWPIFTTDHDFTGYQKILGFELL